MHATILARTSRLCDLRSRHGRMHARAKRLRILTPHCKHPTHWVSPRVPQQACPQTPILRYACVLYDLVMSQACQLNRSASACCGEQEQCNFEEEKVSQSSHAYMAATILRWCGKNACIAFATCTKVEGALTCCSPPRLVPSTLPSCTRWLAGPSC
jgi:hypothetical protein